MSEASVLDALEERPSDACFTYVVTPNVDHAVRLQCNRSDLWPAYRSAWLTLCDSKILALLARHEGLSLPVVPGSDLTRHMFETIIRPSDTITIIGGESGLVRTLIERYGLRTVHHYNPPMGFIHDPMEVARVVRFVIESGARYSFFAVGSPQQEILVHKVEQTGRGRGIGLCIGASLDFLTGAQTRAPKIMRLLALEWLHRLATNPTKMWRRYLYDGPGIFQIVHKWRHAAGKRRRGNHNAL